MPEYSPVHRATIDNNTLTGYHTMSNAFSEDGGTTWKLLATGYAIGFRTSGATTYRLTYDGTAAAPGATITWVETVITEGGGATTLDGLTDVSVGSATIGQYVKKVTTGWGPASLASADISDLGEFVTDTIGANVIATTGGGVTADFTDAAGTTALALQGLVAATSGYYARKASAGGLEWVTSAGGATNLDGLTDVVISGTPASGQVLKYNGTSWVPGTDDVGGGATGAFGVDLSTQGILYNGTDESATLNTALTALAGKTVIVSGQVLAVNITVPDDTRLIGTVPASGFKMPTDTSPNNLLIVGNRVELHNLTLDGNKANQATAGAYGDAIVRITTKADGVIQNCIIKDAKYNGIKATQSSGWRVQDNDISGCTQESIFFQRNCNDNKIVGNKITAGMLDGIKIHGNDSGLRSATSLGTHILSNTVDFRGVTVFSGTHVLAIEIWGGQTAGVPDGGCHYTKIIGNTCYFDAVPAAASVFGISCDSSNYVEVIGNTVLGGAGLGIENAAGDGVTFFGNLIDGYNGYGLSISQTANKRMTVVGNTFANAANSSSEGIGVNDGTGTGTWKHHLIANNYFVDAGGKGVWFNTAGSGSVVRGNIFVIRNQGYEFRGIEALGVNDLVIQGNTFGSERDGSSTFGMQPILIGGAGCQLCVIENNVMDGIVPSTDAAYAADGIRIDSASGRYVVRNNTIKNFSNNPVDTAAATGVVGNVSANIAYNCGAFALRGTDVVTTANVTI